jgi:23S rRNA (uracil1939-C5)-methyltransferase
MPFELHAKKLVYGGDVLGHHEGRTILVPRALPGERLEVEEIRAAKGVVRARPLKVLAAAPERTEPPCPYFARCGGCHYQHFDARSQSAAKREILRETLRRLGKISWEAEIPIRAAQPWNYRNQAEFQVERGAGGRVNLGFFASESHRVVDLEACLILSLRLNTVLATLRRPEWSERLSDCREINMLADDRDEEVMLTLRGTFQPEIATQLAQDCLARLPGVSSVVIEAKGETGSHRPPQVWGKRALVYAVKEFRYQVSPGSFFQTSRFLLPQLVEAVINEAKGSLALDLFAGVGLFTLPLAQRFASVIGVEANAQAAADLRTNARTQGLTNVRAVAQMASDFLRRYAQSPPDLVVLDPPRSGVGVPALKTLAKLRPKRIHCVSCSPPTLARDLEFLLKRGYHLESIELFDLFPQTYHIESIARLSP